MKNSFFSKFTPKEPKFFPLLKQLSDVLSASSVLLVESLEHDLPTERADYYKQIKDMEREGDRLTHLIFDELSTTFITPFDREDIHDLASCMVMLSTESTVAPSALLSIIPALFPIVEKN